MKETILHRCHIVYLPRLTSLTNQAGKQPCYLAERSSEEASSSPDDDRKTASPLWNNEGSMLFQSTVNRTWTALHSRHHVQHLPKISEQTANVEVHVQCVHEHWNTKELRQSTSTTCTCTTNFNNNKWLFCDPHSGTRKMLWDPGGTMQNLIIAALFRGKRRRKYTVNHSSLNFFNHFHCIQYM